MNDKRNNADGGTVEVLRQVWLGYQTLHLPRTRIGADTVVGARSVAFRPLPAEDLP